MKIRKTFKICNIHIIKYKIIKVYNSRINSLDNKYKNNKPKNNNLHNSNHII